MPKNKKILFVLIVCGLVAVLLPSFVLAQTTANKCTPQNCANTPGCLCNPLGTADLPSLIGRVISAVLGIVGSIALLMFIYGGFLWLTSAGSTERITKGKNVLVWATIGLAIIFLSYTLVGFVIKGITSGGTPSTGSQSGNPFPPTGSVLPTGCCSGVVGGCQNVPTKADCDMFGPPPGQPKPTFMSGTSCDTDTGACM